MNAENREVIPLETDKANGVSLFQSSGLGSEGDIYWTQFSPTQRLLFVGGNFDKPSLWDLRNDNSKYELLNMLPHVNGKSNNEIPDMATDVTSVHWNSLGDKMVTSSSDCFARVWKVEEVEAR